MIVVWRLHLKMIPLMQKRIIKMQWKFIDLSVVKDQSKALPKHLKSNRNKAKYKPDFRVCPKIQLLDCSHQPMLPYS